MRLHSKGFCTLIIFLWLLKVGLQAKETLSVPVSMKDGLSSQSTQSSIRNTRFCGSCDFRRIREGTQRRSSHWTADNTLPDSNNTQVIDLMVVYESSVKNLAGGTASLNTLIEKAVEETNLCFSNSLIPVRLRLVHSREVYYTLVNYGKDLDRLSSPSDGYMDSVFLFRDQSGADLVSMLSSIEGDTGGMADTLESIDMSSDKINTFGFSINLWSELGAPEYTLAHEIGHNLGCAHNREAEADINEYLFPYGFGKRWFSDDQGVRTIMAYDDDNVANYPTTIPYFTNPEVYYQLIATGNKNLEDNAQVIRRTASYVSNFRSTEVQGIHTSKYDLDLESGVFNQLGIKLLVDPGSSLGVSVSMSGSQSISMVGPTSLNFNSSNWNVDQEIVLIANNVDHNHTAQITFSANDRPESQVVIPIKILTSVGENPTGWIWLEQYPWAYTFKEQDWLYFSPAGGKLKSFNNQTKLWTELSSGMNPKGWFWFEQYPWVYSNEGRSWLYFKPSDGKLIYYSNKKKSWREFSQ